LWKADIGKGHSNVAIVDNRLYAMGRTSSKGNEVICLNASNGKERWRFPFETLYDSKSTPVIDGEFLYALNGDGLLLCLSAEDGQLRWKRNIAEEFDIEKIRWGYCSSPLVQGDMLVLNVNSSGIALNKNTGELIWASRPHGKEIELLDGYHASPVPYSYDGDRYTLLFSGTGLFSVEVDTGEPLWFYEFYLRPPNCADPVLCGDKVFISHVYQKGKNALLDISGASPKLVWQNQNMSNYFSACVYIDGCLYGSDGEIEKPNRFRCIDVETGDIQWEQQMRMASLTATQDMLILIGEKGTLRLVEATPSAYQEIASFDVLEGEKKLRQFWTPPVLYGGLIYCRNYLGDLICVDVRR
jgi:outer membrane protein assembly factor BamB